MKFQIESFNKFLPFSKEELELLWRAAEKLPLDEIWYTVYRYAARFEEGRRLLKDYNTAEGLKELSQQGAAFFKQAFREIFQSQFMQKARQVARIHLERGVEPVLFMGAMEELKRSFFKTARRMGVCDDNNFFTFSRFFTLLSTIILQEYFLIQQQNLRESLSLVERKSLFLEVLREINLLISQETKSEKKLLLKVCEILFKKLDLSLVWAGKLKKNLKVVPEAVFPLEYSYLEDLSLNLEELKQWGLQSHLESFFQGHPVAINQDHLYGFPWEKLCPHGLRSLAVIPIFDSIDTVTGGIFLYDQEAGRFREDVIRLLSEIGRDVSLGVRYIRQTSQLEETLYKDSLTGLPNERAFLIDLPKYLLSAQTKGKRSAVVRLDVVDFSHINELFGYTGGDQVLAETARRLKEIFVKGEPLARTGPDEFAVCYTFDDLDSLHNQLKKLDFVLKKSYQVGYQPLRIAFGVGIALYPEDATTPHELFEKASLALRGVYREPEGGISFYQARKDRSAIHRLQLIGRLEKALEQEELQLYFQPRISLPTRKPVGFEGLIRWIHPERGVISPAEFIDVLEESDLIVEVGWRMLDLALEFLAQARKFYSDLRVSINVGMRQLYVPNFIDELKKRIWENGFTFQDVEIEITERLLMDHYCERVLHKLITEGLKVALDDFGTGYASFQTLQRLTRMDFKIDRSFILNVPDVKEQVALVMGMVSIGKSLSQRVIAEGVERREQLAFLVGLGVDEVQGYYFAPPLPLEESLKFLKDYNPERFFWKKG